MDDPLGGALPRQPALSPRIFSGGSSREGQRWMNETGIPDSVWVFGYGSLIWRPAIAFRERRVARIRGWTRRFWQGSHDHRGLPDAPGRVVTLVPEPGAWCEGVAYCIAADLAAATFEGLDHREKNGYQRHDVRLEFRRGGTDAGGRLHRAREQPCFSRVGTARSNRGADRAVGRTERHQLGLPLPTGNGTKAFADRGCPCLRAGTQASRKRGSVNTPRPSAGCDASPPAPPTARKALTFRDGLSILVNYGTHQRFRFQSLLPLHTRPRQGNRRARGHLEARSARGGTWSHDRVAGPLSPAGVGGHRHCGGRHRRPGGSRRPLGEQLPPKWQPSRILFTATRLTEFSGGDRSSVGCDPAHE